MIYDYGDKENYVSIWFGNCKSYESLNSYLSTVYLDESASDTVDDLFLACNRNRSCEQELRAVFTEDYNQFEYDFGLLFDEDFREASVRHEYSDSPDALLDGFSAYDTFIDEVKQLIGTTLAQSYNAVVILYHFKYDGDIRMIQRDDLSLEYIGQFKFHF